MFVSNKKLFSIITPKRYLYVSFIPLAPYLLASVLRLAYPISSLDSIMDTIIIGFSEATIPAYFLSVFLLLFGLYMVNWFKDESRNRWLIRVGLTLNLIAFLFYPYLFLATLD